VILLKQFTNLHFITMKDNFIALTSKDGHEIIIGIANIAMILKDESYEFTSVYLNVLQNPSQANSYPFLIEVKESVEKIKNMIGL